VERIPINGGTFVIPAPVANDRPGGFGLDDIRHLLDSTDRDESLESSHENETEERVYYAKIIRASMLFIVPLTFLF
jgi:hypothetical protein